MQIYILGKICIISVHAMKVIKYWSHITCKTIDVVVLERGQNKVFKKNKIVCMRYC